MNLLRPMAVAAAAVLAPVPSAAPQAGQPVAVELLLALDASNSVSSEEFRLQAEGLADAFASDEVVRSVVAKAEDGVAVAVMQWSNAQHQEISIDWRLLRSEADCMRLAADLRGLQRRLKGGTAISAALDYGRRLVLENAFEGREKVIDVSGDGPDLHQAHLRRARDLAVAAGITVNGLAIVNNSPRLYAFYRHHLIGGKKAFVVTANDYGDYAAAMRSKLLRELGPPRLAAGVAASRARLLRSSNPLE